MLIMIAGLVMFLGIHSIRLVAADLRTSLIKRLGAGGWKGVYSLISIGGLILIIWGYGATRTAPVFIYELGLWTRHMALLFTWLAFVLLAATYVPGNQIRARLGHPMYAGIKIWAFAHLLANGRLGDILLFGAFLVWAIAGFAISRRQDRHNHIIRPSGNLQGTLITLAAGSIVWGIFAFWLHVWLIGVNPLPF